MLSLRSGEIYGFFSFDASPPSIGYLAIFHAPVPPSRAAAFLIPFSVI